MESKNKKSGRNILMRGRWFVTTHATCNMTVTR